MGLCSSCVAVSLILAVFGALQQAAIALYGGQAQAIAIDYRPDPEDQKMIKDTQARLDSAVASGAITADEPAQWRAQAEALSLDELAQFTLDALVKALESASAEGKPTET